MESRKEETFKNIDAALDRGKGIEKMIDQADQIECVTFDMSRKAKNLKGTFDCHSFGLYLVLALIGVGFLLVISSVLIFKYAVFK